MECLLVVTGVDGRLRVAPKGGTGVVQYSRHVYVNCK
jgi:hypothetical protein